MAVPWNTRILKNTNRETTCATWDWHAYARSDKLIVKRFHEEVVPHLDLCVDGSRSMDLQETVKAQAAVALAALLITAATGSGFGHRVWLTRDRCEPLVHGDGPPSTWQPFSFDGTESPSQAVARSRPSFRAMGMRIVISDLLWLEQPRRFLEQLSRAASAVLLVQVLAREELAPEVSGKVRLLDSETGATRDMLLDVSAVARYREALESHQQAWRLAARELGVALVSVEAEAFLETRTLDDPGLTGFLQPA